MSKLPPLQRLEMLRRNAWMIRQKPWSPPSDDGTLVRKLLVLLAEAGVNFIVVGGIAVASKASLIGWKSKSVREKDQFDAQVLRRLLEDPRAFD